MKKLLFASVLITISSASYCQWTTNPGPPVTLTTTNTILGVGYASPSQHTGYTSISLNNTTNGGYIDFLLSGTREGYLTGDANGLGLYSGTGTGVHIFANGLEKFTILSNGNVGINQTTPATKFQVTGATLTGGGYANMGSGGPAQDISFMAGAGGSGAMLMGWNRVSEGESDFISNRGPGSGGYAFFDYTTSNVQTELMRIRSTGEVLIGVTNWALSNSIGTNNKLAVGGGIITEAITVKAQGSWPDYVFKSNFKPTSLSKLKAYIDLNHHLPEIPSEADIKKDGQNLGEINKILLKKVEELTLYIIEQQKQIQKSKIFENNSKAEITSLKSISDKQQQEIIEIKKNDFKKISNPNIQL